MRIGVAARADHIMHRAAKIIAPIPRQTVLKDQGHGAQMRKVGIKRVARADMATMDGAGFARKEPLGQVMRIP